MQDNKIFKPKEDGGATKF